MSCCDITLGDLNRKIQIFALDESRAPTGGYSTTWTLLMSVWAKISAKQGREISHGDQLDAIATSEFTIRYRADLVGNESAKITYKGVDYQIRSIVNVDEADEWMTIRAVRGDVQ